MIFWIKLHIKSYFDVCMNCSCVKKHYRYLSNYWYGYSRWWFSGLLETRRFFQGFESYLFADCIQCQLGTQKEPREPKQLFLFSKINDSDSDKEWFFFFKFTFFFNFIFFKLLFHLNPYLINFFRFSAENQDRFLQFQSGYT